MNLPMPPFRACNTDQRPSQPTWHCFRGSSWSKATGSCSDALELETCGDAVTRWQCLKSPKLGSKCKWGWGRGENKGDKSSKCREATPLVLGGCGEATTRYHCKNNIALRFKCSWLDGQGGNLSC